MQYLLHSAEFAAVLLGLFWGPRWYGGLQNSRTKIVSQIGTLKPHGNGMVPVVDLTPVEGSLFQVSKPAL